MLNDNHGFSLVELVVVMAIFVIVIAVTGNAFNKVVSQATQQSRTAEGNIEGVVGLEIMRKDIASAGFGLPWGFTGSISYQEAVGTTVTTSYNDAPSNIPKAICGGGIASVPSGSGYILGSDYLVIKATNIGMSQAAQRWTYMNYTGVRKPSVVEPYVWPSENLQTGDLVTVVRVGLTSTFTKELVIGGGNFYTQYNPAGLSNDFQPTESRIAHYIYGVAPSGTAQLRMPFNRADYYVRIPALTDLPARCANNTGVLYKGVVIHSDPDDSSKNGTLQELPLLDCVADMQVVYLLDTTGSGSMTDTNAILPATSAEQIRQQLKAVKVFVLTHDGGKDRSYSYPSTTIAVGPAGNGREFDLTTIPDYRNYRWKVYFMTVKPENVNVATQ